MSWSKTFTQIDNLNSGNEFGINDYPTPQAFNVPINNTQYLYDVLKNGFLKSFVNTSNEITITATTIDGIDTTYTFDASDIGGAMASDLVDTEKIVISGTYSPTNNSCVLNTYTAEQIATTILHKGMLLLKNTDIVDEDNPDNYTKFCFKEFTETILNRGEEDESYSWKAIYESDLYKITVRYDSDSYSNIYFSKNDIAKRLDDLGFKSGVVTSPDFNLTSSNYSLIKQGNMVLFNINIPGGTFNKGQTYTFNIPNDFVPKTAQNIWLGGCFISTLYGVTIRYFQGDFATVRTDGTIKFTPDVNIQPNNTLSGVTCGTLNAGWKLD